MLRRSSIMAVAAVSLSGTVALAQSPRVWKHGVIEPKADAGPPQPVDFVSENDVRAAIDRGEKIYITKKTILTPSARDLGSEREVFAIV